MNRFQSPLDGVQGPPIDLPTSMHLRFLDDPLHRLQSPAVQADLTRPVVPTPLPITAGVDLHGVATRPAARLATHDCVLLLADADAPVQLHASETRFLVPADGASMRRSPQHTRRRLDRRLVTSHLPIRPALDRPLDETLAGDAIDTDDPGKTDHCVASNHSQATDQGITRGPLERAMLASMAIPGSSSHQGQARQQTDLDFHPPLHRVGMRQWHRFDGILAQGGAAVAGVGPGD